MNTSGSNNHQTGKMSWVNTRYIRVDNNGILTFLPPSAAVVPAAPISTGSTKTGRRKKASTVPAVSTMITAYIRAFGGGSARALRNNIYETSNNRDVFFTRKDEEKAYTALIAYLKNWFEDVSHRGNIPEEGTWDQKFIPDIKGIQQSLGNWLPKGVEWTTLLQYQQVARKPRKRRDPKTNATAVANVSEEENLFDDDPQYPGSYFQKIVDKYTADWDDWPDEQKNDWRYKKMEGYSSIFKIMRLLASIAKKLSKIDNAEENEKEWTEREKYPEILDEIRLIEEYVDKIEDYDVDVKKWKPVLTSQLFRTKIKSVSTEAAQYKEDDI